MNLAETTFWDRLYANLRLGIAARHKPVRQWIERWVPSGTGTCFEIGCYPGRYLAVFGELGYRLSGIDQSSRVLDRLPQWLNSRGYRLGSFHNEDFFEFHQRTKERFQVVCSFGFIEHFSDWRTVLEMHAGLVGSGGLLVVSVPNFRGAVQRRLRELLDHDNLSRHNLATMAPQEWAAHLEPLGFEVQFAGSFGRFDFWSDSELSLWRRTGVLGVKALLPLLRLLPESGLYSPHCGIIARRAG
jgi:SAM-dependent methyltransferase